MIVLCVLAAASSAAGAATTSKPSKSHRQIPSITNATNLSKEPVIHADKAKPPSKVLTKDLVEGTGTAVGTTSLVTVKYVGADYATGKDFTATTWKSGRAATFSLAKVVAGFAAGLVGMKVGGRREIVIPPKYGYGDTAVGPIKANETLVFVVDLVGVSSGS